MTVKKNSKNSFLVKHVTASHGNTEFGKKLTEDLKIWNKSKNKTNTTTSSKKDAILKKFFNNPSLKKTPAKYLSHDSRQRSFNKTVALWVGRSIVPARLVIFFSKSSPDT